MHNVKCPNIFKILAVFTPQRVEAFKKKKSLRDIPANIYLFKINRKARTWCEKCSKLTIKIPERRH